nr:hypothetical protein [Tanacetum cinerariifolium]
YNVLPPPYTGKFLPLKPDLSGLEEFLNEPIVTEPTIKKPTVETSKAKANADKPKALQALMDGKKILINESTIRRDLQLNDAEGVDCLPNAVICEQLTLMGKPRRKVTQVPQPSDPTSVVDEAINEEMDDSLEWDATTATSLDLQQRVLDLETTKTTQALGIDSLKRRVKRLERIKWSRTHMLKILYKIGLSARVESSEDEGLGEEDASKQGTIADIDANKDITLVSTHDKQMFNADQDLGVTTAATTLIISIDEDNLAQALTELKRAKPKAKAKGIVFHKPEESTTTTTAATITKPKSKDKGKAKMIEEPVKLKKKDQIQLDKEVAFSSSFNSFITHDEQMFDADQDLGGEEVFVTLQDENVVENEVDAAQIQVTTAATTLTISIDEATLAQALSELKHAKPKAKAKEIIFYEPEESVTTTAAIAKPKSQDNGKAKMIE